jgi:hypothetical protein
MNQMFLCPPLLVNTIQNIILHKDAILLFQCSSRFVKKIHRFSLYTPILLSKHLFFSINITTNPLS